MRGLLPPLGLVGAVAAAHPAAAEPEQRGRCCSSPASSCSSSRARRCLHLAVPVGAGPRRPWLAMLAAHPYQMRARRHVRAFRLHREARPARVGLAARPVADRDRLRRLVRPRPGRGAAEVPLPARGRTPTSSSPSSAEELGFIGTSALCRAAGAAAVALHARRGARRRPVPLPAGRRTHLADRTLRARQPGRGHGPRSRPPACRCRSSRTAARPCWRTWRRPACCTASAPLTASDRRRSTRPALVAGGSHEGAHRRRRHGRARLSRASRWPRNSSAAHPDARGRVRRHAAAASRRRPCPRRASASASPRQPRPAAARAGGAGRRRCSATLVGFFQAIGIVARERPDVVLGTGGYVSGAGRARRLAAAPPGRAAGAEQRARARQPLARRDRRRGAPVVRRGALATSARRDHLKVTGNPIRALHPERRPRPRAGRSSASPRASRRVFVFGGSRGAHRINEAALDAMRRLQGPRRACSSSCRPGARTSTGRRTWSSAEQLPATVRALPARTSTRPTPPPTWWCAAPAP